MNVNNECKWWYLHFYRFREDDVINVGLQEHLSDCLSCIVNLYKMGNKEVNITINNLLTFTDISRRHRHSPSCAFIKLNLSCDITSETEQAAAIQ